MKKQLLAITLLISAVGIEAKNEDSMIREKLIESTESMQKTLRKLPITSEQKAALEKCKEVRELAQFSDAKNSFLKQAVTKASMKAQTLLKSFKSESSTYNELQSKIKNIDEAKLDL